MAGLATRKISTAIIRSQSSMLGSMRRKMLSASGAFCAAPALIRAARSSAAVTFAFPRRAAFASDAERVAPLFDDFGDAFADLFDARPNRLDVFGRFHVRGRSNLGAHRFVEML